MLDELFSSGALNVTFACVLGLSFILRSSAWQDWD